MFIRDSEDTQESLYMKFQASGGKPRGGNRNKTDFKGARTHPLGC